MAARPRWARWVTRLSLVAALVALVYTIHNTGLATVGAYFRRIGWWWIAVVILEVVITTLDAIAIRAFMSPEKIKLRSTLLAQLAGRAVNAVTPIGSLGEPMKIAVLTEHVSQSRAVATILLYNVVSFSVELAMVAVSAPLVALLIPMPDTLRGIMFASGAICFVLSIGLYAFVRRGMLTSIASGLRKIRILSPARHERWHGKLAAVDDKIRGVEGGVGGRPRARDRYLGIFAILASRLTSLSLSLMILHAVGEPLTVRFVAGYTAGGFVVYMLASLVPMGLGLTEGGYYSLFKALGKSPAAGARLTLARRATLIMYAAVGIILMTANETVRRARDSVRSRTNPTPAADPTPLTVGLVTHEAGESR